MTDPADGVHRLKDIQVEEVSLVDRAANKRRFLLVKREGDMDELRSNGRGGFTRVSKSEEEDTEKAKAPPFGGNKAPPFGKKPEGEEEEKKKAAAAGEEEDTEKAKKKPEEKQVFENEESDNAEMKRKAEAEKADTEAVAEDLEGIAKELLEMAEELEGAPPSDVDMRKVASAHKKLGAMVDKYARKTAKNAVAKVGAKMSAARLSTFKESLQSLQSLLNELLEKPGKASGHDPDPGDPQGKPSGWSASNPSDAPSNAMGAAAVKQLAKMVAGIVEINKAQARKIARLEKGIVGSNSIPVEKSNGRGQDDVSWPMDMNTPNDRGSVSKSESFYDD